MWLLLNLLACTVTDVDSQSWEQEIDEPYEVMRIHAEAGTVTVIGTDDARTQVWGSVSFPAGERPDTEAVITDGELRLGADCGGCVWSWELRVPREVALDIEIEGDGVVEIEDISGDVVAQIGGEGALIADMMASASFTGRLFDGGLHTTFLPAARDIDLATERDGAITVMVEPGAWNLETTETLWLDAVEHDPDAGRTIRAASRNVVEVKGRAYVDL